MNLQSQRICITGGAGFLGRYVCQALQQRGVSEDQIFVPRKKDFDLTHETDVQRLYEQVRPTVVIHLAAEVGGIGANRAHPGRFFYANMAMGMNMVEEARKHNLQKFVHTGTVCAYPNLASVPFKESDLWNGYPEATNAPYGIAKKALFVMLDGYKREYNLNSSVVVPVNLYGPGDNFDPETSHVIPALIRKCEEARVAGHDSITCWGTGSPSREFLYVKDAARGIVAATEKMDEPLPINLGTGNEITIKNLITLIAKLVGFEGDILWDATKPDGQPRRQLDTSLAAEKLGWSAQVDFEQGLKKTIEHWRTQTKETPPCQS